MKDDVAADGGRVVGNAERGLKQFSSKNKKLIIQSVSEPAVSETVGNFYCCFFFFFDKCLVIVFLFEYRPDILTHIVHPSC